MPSVTGTATSPGVQPSTLPTTAAGQSVSLTVGAVANPAIVGSTTFQAVRSQDNGQTWAAVGPTPNGALASAPQTFDTPGTIDLLEPRANVLYGVAIGGQVPAGGISYRLDI